jgi:hypothetical protein
VLFESIELVMGEKKYTQSLYYVNILFHCHKVGHVVKDYVYSFHHKIVKSIDEHVVAK